MALVLGISASTAFAEEHHEVPWWHINVGSRPTYLPPGGQGTVVLFVTNLGDGEVNGKAAPVTVTDRLPEGIEATEAIYIAHGFLNLPIEEPCSVASGSMVTCGFSHALSPYERLEIKIKVKVAPEPTVSPGKLPDEVSVSGGGAPSVSVSDPLTVNPSKVPFGVETYEIVPENAEGSVDTQAGSHPFQLTTTLTFNAGAETVGPETGLEVQQSAMPKDLHFALPPGLIGNPTPFPRCPEALLYDKDCPADTQLGVTVVAIGAPDPGTLTEPVYNLTPAPGEPARFGFETTVGPVFLDVSVRSGGDYGVTVSVDNITQLGQALSAQTTIWGIPGDPRHNRSRDEASSEIYCLDQTGVSPNSCPKDAVSAPFLALPTACGNPVTEPFEATVTGSSWSGPSRPSLPLAPVTYALHDQTSPSIALDGCEGLSFEPSIKVTPDGAAASAPTGLGVDVHVPQQEILTPNGDAESAVKDITVTLPEGVTLNAAAADGLEACSEALVGFEGFKQLQPGSEAETATFTEGMPSPLEPGANFCPNASKVGTVKIKTPLLPNELEGAVYLATQEENPFGSLIAMYIVAEDPVSGTLVKLPGEVSLTPTGQIEATFKNNPQLPFEDAKLEFFGGERAPLSTPTQCGTYTTEASFTPWSGNEAVSSQSHFEIASGPHGSPCPNPLPFAPTLTAQTTSVEAGGYSPFTMAMSREDGNQQLQGIQLHMPPGLLGMLSSVKLCEEPQADQGECGEESKIGETTVSVGLGGDPYSVTGGRVFVTGPYAGAPYGLAIEEPAKAGPFDLEHTKSHSPGCDCLVVRARIEVNPVTTALTVTTNSPAEGYAIPVILEGIPLQIKHVYVAVDRPSFTFNPTDCNPLKITGGLTSAEGASASLEVPFQITDCAALAFKPKFAVSTSAHSSRVDGASLDTTVTYPSTPQGTEADIAKVKVSLPAKLPARLTTLQKACPEQTFAEHPTDCPAASRVGEATAKTPVLPTPLGGPAYFVSHGGAKYPELVIELTGDNVTIDLHGETAISKKGVLTSTFNTVPDAPFSSFELLLPEGPYSALTANGANLCKAGKLIMPTELVAQDDAVIHQSTRLSVTGCPKKARHGAKRKAGKHRK
ncbi:MAG TPA: hypothetical protein VG147_15080 [Solirubrobacteraceae bacterium]|nr:hypothetical protein [Solirubrobacteraceae bacterium]